MNTSGIAPLQNKSSEAILELYSQASSRVVGLIDPAEHTMSAVALEAYVRKNFSPQQNELIESALDAGIPIEVHGVFQGHLPVFLQARQLSLVKDPIQVQRRSLAKIYNRLRPLMCRVRDVRGDEALCLFVFPSRDYVIQTADVLAHHILFRLQKKRPGRKSLLRAEQQANGRVTRYHHRQAEETISQWSGLASYLNSIAFRDDIVIMGEVEYIARQFETLGFEVQPIAGSQFVRFGADKMYGLHIMASKKAGRRVFLLGVEHCYWGEAAGLIACALAEAGVTHIIYSAKTANLIGEEQRHTIVCPSKYCLFNEERDDPFDFHHSLSEHSVPSELRDSAPLDKYRTGLHLSMASVIRQTISQAKIYCRLRPATLDAEISYIARAIENHNKSSGKCVNFTALHFVTDYLYPKKTSRAPKINLVYLGPEYEHKKNELMIEISRVLASFVTTHGGLQPGSTPFDNQAPGNGRARPERPTFNELRNPKEFLDCLERRWAFRWEPTSLSEPVTVFWPLRVRAPGPIHAVHAFAAAGLQRLGARIVLCLDDMRSPAGDTARLQSAIESWFWRMNANPQNIESWTLSRLGGEIEAGEWWRHVQMALGQTEEKLENVLQVAKLISDKPSAAELRKLLARHPGRLLTAPMLWCSLSHFAQKAPNMVITLGGNDEQQLWKMWKACVPAKANVGHLYTPILQNLGQPGNSLRMERTRLDWKAMEDIERDLKRDMAIDGWKNEGRLVWWCHKLCVALPAYLLSEMVPPALNGLSGKPEGLLKALSEATKTYVL